jgi:hypothetical protein
MANFESAMVVKRKLWIEFGTDKSGLIRTKDTFERFCKTDTVEDRERSGRPSKITEEKIEQVSEVLKINRNRVFGPL